MQSDPRQTSGDGAHSQLDDLLALVEDARHSGDKEACKAAAKGAISFLNTVAGPEIFGWLDFECASDLSPLPADATDVESDKWLWRRTRHALALFLFEFAPQFDFSGFGGSAVVHELRNMNDGVGDPHEEAAALAGSWIFRTRQQCR